MSLKIRLMTATLSPGDAIGNYITSLAHLLQGWGASVELYADHVSPDYNGVVYPSHACSEGGDGLLWYHYSIDSDNVSLLLASKDYRVVDYHGISPPHLFAGENERLAALCRRGQERLPAVAASADYLITHSGYTTGELRQLGMQKILEYPLFVDTARFGGEDPELAGLLAQAGYLLFVGRIVPQKDIRSLLEIFDHVRTHYPDLLLILAGARDLVPGYQVALEEFIRGRGLSGRVLFTGQINNPAVLAALYRHARLVVIASKWESFCVPVAESLYFGTPVAVNNIPPLPEVAGEAGLVFDSAEPEVAASRIAALLENEGAYAALQEAAGKQAARYSGPALALNVRRLLERIAGDTQLSAPQGITAGTP